MDNLPHYTLKEAAEALNVSVATIRRYINQGKLIARKVKGRYGPEYEIPDIPRDLLVKPMPVKSEVNIGQLIARIEELDQEVGYWRGKAEELRGKAEELEKRVLLLETPKLKPWWRRLLRI